MLVNAINETLSALEQSEMQREQSEVLLKEIHHRVKNNLQIISSLLGLQTMHVQDPAFMEILEDSKNRVRAMALVHEKLYDSNRPDHVHFDSYIKDLVRGLNDAVASSVTVRVKTEGSGVVLNVEQAIPAGMIVNELVSNCFKHAFQPDQTGTVDVVLVARDDHTLTMSVRDDGVGMADDVDINQPQSLGLQIVGILVKQLDGTLALDRSNGTTVVVTFSVTQSHL